MADEGVMRVHVLEAHLTHKIGFGKMDPYVKMSSREQTWKSPVSEDGGKEPKWNHGNTWDITVHYLGDELHLEVWNDEVGRDHAIGVGATKLAALAVNGGIDEWYSISHEGEDAGRVRIKSEWHPKVAEGNHHGFGHH